MAKPENRVATHGVRCFSKIKMFLFSLTMAYVAKSLSGTYMNSMLTQIERQFDISTSVVGLINGSFEIGNLLLIIFMSYFGTKRHRPLMIGVGCVVMGLGCFLMSLPHFLMGRTASPKFRMLIWKLEDIFSILLCIKEIKSSMWVYVMVGNVIRGTGETPIMPLGISYIEDFAKSENSPLYIGILKIGVVIGPLIGLMLATFCANIYVDSWSVNTDDLTITPTDTRWVGAWWVGFLICAGVNVLTSIPFFFFPKTLPKEGQEDNVDVTKSDKEVKHRGKAKEEKHGITKDFLPFMKSLFCNSIYMLFILLSVLHLNAIVIIVTFMPKYLEQQYGKSTAEIVFLIGLYTLPPIFVGYVIGGLIMKKFKTSMKKAAYIAFCLSLTEFLLSFFYFLMTCDNFPVAGLTTSYDGYVQPLYVENIVLDDCNTRCNCLTKTWDPVCGDNGLAYMSACLAGCEKSVGTGINMVFQNCSCIGSSGNSSAVLGLCKKGPDCTIKLQYFFILVLITSLIYSLAVIPGYMVLLRCVKSEEKSLGIGLHAFCTRVFGMNNFLTHQTNTILIVFNRNIYIGVPAALRGLSYLPAFFILKLMRKRQLPGETDSSETELAETKLTEKKTECVDVHRSPEVENDRELKTKL
uniref:Solute carrier organic anion transporter family member n=1 Tax=Peromyscus maniculatus bairdii TaxID=230844 RepID=A0A8C8UIK3_PERMB